MDLRERAPLLRWAKGYWQRDGANSFQGHLARFQAFHGCKLRLRDRLEVEEFVVTLEGGL